MLSTTSLITDLQAEYPRFRFAASNEFRWSPSESTVFYDQASTDVAALLHELSHAILGHEVYTRDVGLVELERKAWQYAQEVLGPHHSIPIDNDDVEDSLDTYRDWLHARSTCPTCGATGIQIKQSEYKCLVCSGKRWRVNDGRSCALRRYKVTK